VIRSTESIQSVPHAADTGLRMLGFGALGLITREYPRSA